MFIFSAIAAILLIIATYGFLIDKENKGGSYLLIPACLFSAFMFIAAKDIFQISTAILIWKISSGIIILSSLGIALWGAKSEKSHRITSLFFVSLVGGFPFYINMELEQSSSHESVVNILKNNLTIQSLIIIIAILFIILIIIQIKNSITRRKRTKYELNFLRAKLESNKYEDTDKLYFRDPYNNLLKEEFSLFSRKIDKYLSSTLHDMQRVLEEIKYRNDYEILKPKDNDFLLNIENSIIVTEISDIKRNISILMQQNSNKEFDNLDVVKELNHFIATPFSSVISNLEIIRSKLGKKAYDVHENLDRIKSSIDLCKCVIATYREVAILSTSGDTIIGSLSDIVKNAVEIFKESHDKKNLIIEININDTVSGFSNHYLISILMPLLENAIVASPKGSLIKLYQQNDLEFIIENKCTPPPNLKDLNTQGYSSKDGHKGTGLMIVRHLLGIKKQGALSIAVDKNNVIQTVKLNTIQ